MARKRKHQPGDVFFSEEEGAYVQIDEQGEARPFVPHPHEPFPEFAPDPLDYPRRADGTVAPFYSLDQRQLERLDQDTPRGRRVRHDGWTLERQKDFIERLAASASVTDAARYVDMSRQSARDLYNRSPQFRAAWDEALRGCTAVLAETAFDRAVNGVQEQVWHKGEMVGFREKYNDRLLMFLLRVRDPLNFAPLADLRDWQRFRAVEQGQGIGPTLDRLEAAERAWAQADVEPPALPAPADRLAPPAAPETPSHVTSSESSRPATLPPRRSRLRRTRRADGRA